MTDRDPTLGIRLEHAAQISAAVAAAPDVKAMLIAKHGEVWTTDEMTTAYETVGFLAPYVVVTRRADRVTGTLQFSGYPRYYFNFVPHQA